MRPRVLHRLVLYTRAFFRLPRALIRGCGVESCQLDGEWKAAPGALEHRAGELLLRLATTELFADPVAGFNRDCPTAVSPLRLFHHGNNYPIRWS